MHRLPISPDVAAIVRLRQSAFHPGCPWLFPGDVPGQPVKEINRFWSQTQTEAGIAGVRSNIDFIGIDNYMPISDWRDGWDHHDAALAPAIYDRAYPQSNIAGGEGFDWFYANPATRDSQTRTPVTDGAAGKPWVFCFQDLRAW